MSRTDILDEQVIFQHGSLARVRRWLRGVHPGVGTIIQGFTGWETVVEADVIKPKKMFFVLQTDVSPVPVE